MFWGFFLIVMGNTECSCLQSVAHSDGHRILHYGAIPRMNSCFCSCAFGVFKGLPNRVSVDTSCPGVCLGDTPKNDLVTGCVGVHFIRQPQTASQALCQLTHPPAVCQRPPLWSQHAIMPAFLSVSKEGENGAFHHALHLHFPERWRGGISFSPSSHYTLADF